MEGISTALSGYMFGIALAYFGTYLSYYFSIVNGLSELTDIRNDKIKRLVDKVFKARGTNQIDFFFLIDDLNKDNKVWLLDTDKTNNIFKFSLWFYGIISFFSSGFFLFRSNLLDKTTAQSFSYFDILVLALYVFSLAWTVFHFYWDYVYFKEFRKAEKNIKKEISMNLLVTDRKE